VQVDHTAAEDLDEVFKEQDQEKIEVEHLLEFQSHQCASINVSGFISTCHFAGSLGAN
jgi:hypothetical protein